MKKILMTFHTQIFKKLSYSFLFVLLSVSQLLAQQTDLLQSGAVIKQHAAAIGLSEDDLKNYRISDAYIDKTSGATIYYLQQTYKGADVLNAIQTVAIKNNQVLSTAGTRIANMEQRVNIKDAIASLTAADAVRVMARHLNLTVPALITVLKTSDDKKIISFNDLGISTVPVQSKLIWLADVKTKKVSLVWQVKVQPKGVPDYWLVHVDASKGDVLGKMNLNINCTWWGKEEAHETIAHDHSTDFAASATTGVTGINAINSAAYRVIPFPAESPIHTGGTAALVSNPWELAGTGNNATTLKWNDDGTTTYDSTRGNNVLAQDDRDGKDNTKGKGAKSSTASPDLTFDFTPDYALEPTVSVNQNFAITNLFYWNNIVHDISYQYGFDETAGNFQANNLSRGGLGNDYVFADAQDGISKNNANFATPPDGQNPRMQMFLFDGSPKIDGDLDNGVVSHEYTHGISNRLTGGPSQVTCLENAEQMGEGWSDYLALMVTTDWKTATINDGTKKRPIGNYVSDLPTTGGGIRRYPYSTDITIDPLTYADMTATDGEPHNVGEIWCTALWEMTWAIIQMDGSINKNIYAANSTGGNSAALKLVMEGMKLQPCSPGFIDGRDAILKADTLLYGGKYSCAIWNAFRKRGMGYYALQRSTEIVGDEKADFNSFIFVKTASKDSLVQQEQVTYTFKINAGPCAAISNYKIVDTLSQNVTYVSSTGTYNAANRTVTFNNINLAANSNVSYTIKATVNSGTYIAPVQHINEPIAANAVPAGWSVYKFKTTVWAASTTKSHSAPYAMFAKDTTSTSLTRFTTSAGFPLTNNSTFSFWHYYNTESGWDGGRVEYSINNGVTFTDIGKYMIQNGYQNTIYDSVSKGFRAGFSGSSNGFIRTVIDLSSLAGKTVRFRFVFTSDQAVGVEGWYVDDINLASESGIQNLGQFFDNSSNLLSSSPVYSTIKAGTLPVTWGEFTAFKQGSTALLKWQTLQEYNTANFVIERSTDGEHFHQLATIAAAGNSSVAKTYQFTDKLPLNGKGYYRIMQVDKDGRFTYSPVRSLEFLLKTVVNITPNPAKDKIAITVSGNDKALKIYLMDATGKQVKSFDMQGQYLQLNLPAIAPGIYYIKITGDAVNHTQKLVIQ